MREVPPYYDDFVKSISNGEREFQTEEEVIDCFEDYVSRWYKYEVSNPNYSPRNEIRYVYKVSYENNPLVIIYVESQTDAMEYENEAYSMVEFIRTCNHSDIYRQANTNSTRSAIENFLNCVDLRFKIGGELKTLEYFGEPERFRDRGYE
jgi:hypothetical protein